MTPRTDPRQPIPGSRHLRLQGRLLYLPHRAQIVVPLQRSADGGWRCVVVGRAISGSDDADAPEMVVSDAEIASALDVPQGYPSSDSDGDTYAAIWQACANLRFPAGQLRQVADHLATVARRPGAVTVELDVHTVNRLLVAVRSRSTALHRLLARLCDAGMLTAVHPRQGQHLGLYALTMPAQPVATRPAAEPGS